MRGCRHLRLEALAAFVFLLGVEAGSAEEPAASPSPRRAVSWVTEVLAAELPKYEARPPAVETEATTADEPAVEREGVLNLPTLTVRPVMKESPTDYSFLTAKGRMELALKTYPGLRIGNLLGLNNYIAEAKMVEEQEVRRKTALYHRVEQVLLDDADSRETRRLLKSALGRANVAWLIKHSNR